MTSFNDWWRQLEVEGTPLPYMLIDCAGIEGGEAALPRETFSELKCLFTGELADELVDVGGYLGRLKSWDDSSTVLDLLKRQVAVILTLPESAAGHGEPEFAQMHRHLRKFNVIYGPADKPLFWRYYDPRVLPDVLGVLDATQLAAFFGLVDVIAWADADGELKRARVAAGAFTAVQ